MRLALAALALATPAASAAGPPPALKSAPSAAPARLCHDEFRVYDARRQRPKPPPLRARPLAELPPGDLLLAVINEVGGCIERVKVRQGYGR